MEQWEQEALGSFQQQFSSMQPPTPPGGGAGGPVQPQASAGPSGVDMGQVIKDEVLSGPAAHLGRGLVRGAADLGDSVIGLGQRAMGGEPTNPLGSMVSEHIDPHFKTATNKNNPVANAAAKSAEFVGEVTAPMVAGGKAVQVVGNGLGKVAPASQRLSRFLQSFRNFGAGPAPAPGAGLLTNAGYRMAGGAAAGGVAAAAGDPDNPGGMALGAAGGAVIGPGMHKLGQGLARGNEIAQNALNPNRVPQLRDKVIRDVVGDRTQQVLNNLGQAPNRITPGLPHQVAQDPGISSLHRTLGQANVGNSRYADAVTDFTDRQAGDLASGLRHQSHNLDALKAQREAAVRPLYDQLNTSQQPISLRIPARDAFSRILPGGKLQGSKQGKHLLDAAKPLIVKHPDGAAVPPLLPKGRGLLQQAPAGVLSNIKQDINAMLKDDYMPKPGRVKMDEAGKSLLLQFKASLDEALNRASPAKGDAAKLNRAANKTYSKMSVPVNQTQHIRDLYDNALMGEKTMHGAEQVDPTKIANLVRDMQQNPKVWNHFTPQQRTWLSQIQQEAPTNVAAGSYGSGTVHDAIAASAVPKAVVSSTRPLPGPMGRATSVLAKVVAGRQIGRVEDALAEVMAEPGGVQTIMQILQTQPQALAQASGLTPMMMQRLFSASAPMATQ